MTLNDLQDHATIARFFRS